MNRNSIIKAGAIAIAAIVAAAVILTTHEAFARGHRGRRADGRLQFLTVALDLTQAQQQAILPILQDEGREMQDIHEKYRGSRGENMGAAHEEIQTVRGKYSDLIAAQLTEDQAAKYRKLEDLRGGMGPGARQRGPNPEHRLEMLTVILDLTDSQRQAILPILQEESAQIGALHESYRSEGKGKNRGEMRELHAKYANLVAAQLTDAQAAKFWQLQNGVGCGHGKKHGHRMGPPHGE